MFSGEQRKVEDIIRVRKLAHSYYSKRSEVYRAFIGLEATAFAEGALSKKHKELIATGTSVALNCESCMEWHIGEALRSGATRDEIVEAIGVAIELGGGRATVSARFAASALEYHAGHLANRRPNPDPEPSQSPAPRQAASAERGSVARFAQALTGAGWIRLGEGFEAVGLAAPEREVARSSEVARASSQRRPER